MTAIDVAREYLPDWPDEVLEEVIWSETGWPCFWRGEPLDSLRLQLAKVRAREYDMELGYRDCDQTMADFKLEDAG